LAIVRHGKSFAPIVVEDQLRAFMLLAHGRSNRPQYFFRLGDRGASTDGPFNQQRTAGR